MPEVAEMEPKVISAGLLRMVKASGPRLCAGGLLSVGVCRRKVYLLWRACGLRKWCSLPRLETRTKESDTGASIVVANHSAQ